MTLSSKQPKNSTIKGEIRHSNLEKLDDKKQIYIGANIGALNGFRQIVLTYLTVNVQNLLSWNFVMQEASSESR